MLDLLQAILTKKERVNAARKASEHFVRTSKAADSYIIALADDFINKNDRDFADAEEREDLMNGPGDLQFKVGKAKQQVHSFYTLKRVLRKVISMATKARDDSENMNGSDRSESEAT